ncbi:MAG: cyclic nucleotide-binding domain-containing protein [Myxococcota bacterium]
MGNAGLEELGISDDVEETEAPPEPDASLVSGEVQVGGEDYVRSLIQALKGISLFDGLLPLHIERIAALVQEVQFKKNNPVFRHGEEGDGLYLIMHGSIRISRSVSGMGEEALAVLKPGMYFGEMSIVDDDVPRSADAIAHEDSRLLKLPKDDLRDLMFVDRELAYELLWRFVRTLSTRLRDSNDRLLMLTVSSKF